MQPGDLAVVRGIRTVDVWRERPGEEGGPHRSGEKFVVGDLLIFLAEWGGNMLRVLHPLHGACLIHSYYLHPVQPAGEPGIVDT
jgi:hypothetical protein